MTVEVPSPLLNGSLDYGQPLEFGYFLDPDAGDPHGVLATARRLERLGYDLVGVQDHPYQPRHLDTLSLLATVLAQTETVRVFADVGNLPLRPPAVLAKAAATLDLLSGGRFELGIGAGGMEAAQAMGAPGRTPAESLEALEEAVALMRAFWSGERRGIRFDGRYYQLAGVHLGPAPTHPIQVWIGANKPRALALTGRVADGWVSPLTSYKPPREAARANLVIDRAARDAGRDRRAIRRIYNVQGAFTGSAQGPAADTDQSITGPPEHWAEVLTHLTLDIGFSTFVLATPPGPHTLATFIEEVAPQVRERVAERRASSPVPAISPEHGT
jgi:alkanesulfonate monooxygenase SsuD/methylene tetrahydromethanopterin reductase-like flavin-dependent oxidoreductase (luciferase family)